MFRELGKSGGAGREKKNELRVSKRERSTEKEEYEGGIFHFKYFYGLQFAIFEWD